MTTGRINVIAFFCTCAVGACAAPGNHEGSQDVASSAAATAPMTQVNHDPPTWCKGLPVEVEETRSDDGTLQVQRSVVKDKDGNSVPHGPTVRFYQSGEKKLEINYQCGVKHGVRTAWYRDGTKWSEGWYVNDLDNGTWTEWYPDGEKSQAFTMHYGAWNGVHTQWYPDGGKKRELHYVNGVIQGPLVFWDDVGAVLASIDFVDGREQPTPQGRP